MCRTLDSPWMINSWRLSLQVLRGGISSLFGMHVLKLVHPLEPVDISVIKFLLLKPVWAGFPIMIKRLLISLVGTQC